jgi:hypothetical protein
MNGKMNKQDIQAILEKLSIEEGALSDFTITLGDIHGQIANALQVAPVFAEQQEEERATVEGGDEDPYPSDDDDGWGAPTNWGSDRDEDDDYDDDEEEDYDDQGDHGGQDEAAGVKAFMTGLLTDLHSHFNEGGVLSAAKYLTEVLHNAGVDIDIDEQEEALEDVNYFIREYGLIAFFSHEFISKHFFADDADPATTTRDPLDKDPLDKELLDQADPEPPIESHSSDTISEEMFDAVKGKFADRQTDWPVEPERISYSTKLTPEQRAFTSVNTTHKFFEGESSGNNYLERLRAARGESDHITPLNFHPIFKNLGDKATGLVIDETVDPPVVSVSLDKMTTLRHAVGLELAKIRRAMEDMQSILQGIARREDGGIKDALISYNEKRRALANKLDDLLSAVKRRDEFIADLLYTDYRKRGFKVDRALRERGYELSSDFRDKDSLMATDLLFICSALVFVDIQKEVFQLGESSRSVIPTRFKQNYEALSATFNEIYMHQLHNKIYRFFEKTSSGAWARSSFCSWIARGIQRAILCNLAYNREFQVKTKAWQYSSCAVCGKNVYTRTAISNPKGSGRKGSTSKADYSEYEVPSYSLFTENGGLITEEALAQREGGFPPPGDRPEYEGNKTWIEISTLVNSGSKAEHMEGVVRRSEALLQLGARKISETESPVSAKKYKCPYSDEGDRPADLVSAIEGAKKGGTSWNPKVTDFDCGLYLDPKPIIDSGGEIPLESLQMVRPPSADVSPRGTFEAKIDAAIESGELDGSVKDRFMAELERRAGGGWKFSNKFFNCPTKIDIPKEHRTKEMLREEDYLSKYSYLASPISGPVSAGATVYNDDGSIDVESSRLYPPIDGEGQPAELVNGTMTYLVCGAKTSLSSFKRHGEGSLSSAIKTLMDSAVLFGDERGSQASERVQALVETLLELGVDLGDILPFIKDPTKSPVEAMEAITQEIDSAMSEPEPDTLAVLENYGRLSKISQLLSVAMASPVDLGKRVKGTTMERIDVIGDIKLVCNHGHVFSVRDSVYFGRTHTGINFRNRSKFAYDRDSIIDSGVLLNPDGVENFEATFLNLKDKGDRPYMSATKESNLIGPDSTRTLMYSEWKSWMESEATGSKKHSQLSRTMFLGPNGDHYGFNAVPRTFVWGSEEGNKFSSARERESLDGATRTYLESLEAFIGSSGEVDSDGKYTSQDSETQHALEKWKRERSDDGLGGAGSKALAARGEEGLGQTTAIVGKLLRSFLLSMQGWLKLATTLEVHGSMIGRPDAINIEEQNEGTFGLVLIGSSKRAIEAIIRQVELEDEDEMSGEAEALLEQSFSHFKEKYLSQLQNTDKRLLYHSSENVREFLAVGITKSILRSIPSAYGSDAGEVAAVFRSDLTEKGAVDYASLYEKARTGGPTAGSFIEEIIEALKPASLSEKDRARVLLDPLATGKDGDWYGKGRPTGTKEGITSKVAKMKGKEYMGRTLEGASALYIADVVSNAYNLYMRDEVSPSYIGYDIGLDLSTSENVLNLTHADLNEIVIGISSSEYAEKYGNEEDREHFYEESLTPITECSESLQAAIFSLRTACTSAKYMKKSTEYITKFLSDIVEEVSETEDPGAVNKARLIIDNVMTNSPFTTISLNSDGKYRKYHGGRGAVDTENILPSFGGVLVRLNSDKQSAIYPIYKLVDSVGVYHAFDIDIAAPPVQGPAKECYVLSREDLPGSTEPLDLNEALPDSYRRNGWRIFAVTMGRGPDQYSDFTGKTGSSNSNKGWTEGVSVAYHPGTSAVRGEQEELLGYSNDELGLNSAETLFIGPLSVRRGNEMSFPPNPYTQSNIGIPIPIDFKGVDTTSTKPVFPIVGTRIPVEINSSESDMPVSVDMSSFLQRDPPEEALRIILRIEELYKAYKQKLLETEQFEARARRDKNRQAMEYIARFRENMKKQYQDVISSLHSTYRGLPLNVASGNVSTVKASEHIGMLGIDGSAERLRPRNSLYLPLVDWVTMHRMVSSEAFSPEWGGHQLWPAGDDVLKSRRKEAVEEFLIKTNNLDTLARQIALKLDGINSRQPGSTVIDPLDLLDPVERLVGNGIVTGKNIREVFGQTIEAALTEIGVSGRAWVGLEGKTVEERKKNVAGGMLKRFPAWVKGQGSFYPVGSTPREDSVSEDPSAYIKIMNVVFPSNKAGPKSVSPREKLDRARDPNNSDILSIDECYSHSIISGVINEPDPTYFPLPEDEKGLDKYKRSLKKVTHISVARYAEAISEYLANFVKRDLEPPLEEPLKEAVSSFGLVKFSEKRNANMYYGGIINDEGLLALWNLVNK